MLNTLLFSNPASVKSLVALYGRQAIVASLDVKLNNNYYEVRAHHGTEKQEMSLSEAVNFVIELGAGENSSVFNGPRRNRAGLGYEDARTPSPKEPLFL